MEFLNINDTSYSDGKPGKSTKDNVNIVLSVMGQGLELKTQTKINEFVGGLKDTHKKYFEKVVKSKTTDQEKAIISALLNKYPKLKVNEAQQREFRKHLENLLATDKIEEGALKYLLERLLEVDKQKKEEEEANTEPEGEPPTSKEGGEEVQAEEGVQAEQPQAADSENSAQNSDSDLEFYSEWEKEFNNTDCELSEDDFNDMIDEEELDCYLGYPSNQRATSEYIKKNSLNKAEEFLDSKRAKYKETKYSSLMVAEDFIVSRLLIKDSEYSKPVTAETSYSSEDHYTNVTGIANKVKSTISNNTNNTVKKVLDVKKYPIRRKSLRVAPVAAGAGLGLLASSVLTTKLHNKYKSLKEKKNRTKEEDTKLKNLKRRLISIKVGSTVAGGIAGNEIGKRSKI